MSEYVPQTVTEEDDGRFIRTAIVVPEKGASFSLVEEDGVRFALINAFVYYDDEGHLNHVIIDVIDNDNKFPKKFALTFDDGVRKFTDTNGNLVSADFRKE